MTTLQIELPSDIQEQGSLIDAIHWVLANKIKTDDRFKMLNVSTTAEWDKRKPL